MPHPPLAAVVFDMDGTITKPVHDFDAIRAAIGIPERLPILEYLETAPPDFRARAEEILARFEREAIERTEPNPGAAELFAFLARRGLPTGVVTRNTLPNAEEVLRRAGVRVDTIVSRHCAPPKPSPEPLLLVARRLGVAPAAMAMVGDFRFDIEAGRAAGMRTALLTNGDPNPPDWGADRTVSRLDDLIAVFEGWME